MQMNSSCFLLQPHCMTRPISSHHLDPTNLLKLVPIPTEDNHQPLLTIRQHDPVLFLGLTLDVSPTPFDRDDLDRIRLAPARRGLPDGRRSLVGMKQVARCRVDGVGAEYTTDGGIFASCRGEYKGSRFGETDSVATVFVGVVACTEWLARVFYVRGRISPLGIKLEEWT